MQGRVILSGDSQPTAIEAKKPGGSGLPVSHRFDIGLGLRIPHYSAIFSTWPQVDFFEIISENFMPLRGLPRQNLERILDRYRVVLHGTALGLANAAPLDPDYLAALKRLCEFTRTPYFTDHLCWTTSHGQVYHDLLPIPYTEANARFAAEKAAAVQDFVGLPFGIENLSSYAEFNESEMPEWEFYNRVVELSGCRYMLDINNVYVSSVNHGFDPREYLLSIDYSKVLQCHVAGHTANPDGTILDTHDDHVSSEVWALYAYAWELSGGFHTLLEWDGKFIGFEETHREALKARHYQRIGVRA